MNTSSLSYISFNIHFFFPLAQANDKVVHTSVVPLVESNGQDDDLSDDDNDQPQSDKLQTLTHSLPNHEDIAVESTQSLLLAAHSGPAASSLKASTSLSLEKVSSSVNKIKVFSNSDELETDDLNEISYGLEPDDDLNDLSNPSEGVMEGDELMSAKGLSKMDSNVNISPNLYSISSNSSRPLKEKSSLEENQPSTSQVHEKKQLTLEEILLKMRKNRLDAEEKANLGSLLESAVDFKKVVRELHSFKREHNRPVFKGKRKGTTKLEKDSETSKNFTYKMNKKILDQYLKVRLAKASYETFHSGMESFFSELRSGVSIIRANKKSNLINKDDVYILMKELGIVKSWPELQLLCENMLPFELWNEIFPVSLPFGK